MYIQTRLRSILSQSVSCRSCPAGQSTSAPAPPSPSCASMTFQHFAILASLATVTLAASFEFVPNPGKCSDSSQQCVLLSKCPAFRTRAQVLRRRPVVCGFSGGGVKVCCGSVIEQLISTTPSPLPQQCGEPRSAADFAVTETAPTSTVAPTKPVRRRRSAPVEDIPPPPPHNLGGAG